MDVITGSAPLQHEDSQSQAWMHKHKHKHKHKNKHTQLGSAKCNKR